MSTLDAHELDQEAEAAERDAANLTDPAQAATLHQQADSLIKSHVLAATTLGLLPFPMFDLAVLAGNQVVMVHGLAQLYGVPFDKARTRAIVVSLVSGSAPVVAVGLGSSAKLIPGIGSLLGSGSVAVGGGALTYAVGQAFARHFETGGNLFDVDVKGLRGLFKSKLKEGKEVAAAAEAPAESAA